MTLDLLAALEGDIKPATHRFPVGGGQALLTDIAPATESNAAFTRARVEADARVLQAVKDAADAPDKQDRIKAAQAEASAKLAADALLVGWRSEDGSDVVADGSPFPATPENRLAALKASPELLAFVQRKAVAGTGFVLDRDAEEAASGNSLDG